jgi:hypothetical protein
LSEAKPTVPYGYCHCGCGQKTRIAPQTSTARGWVRGEPIRFIQYHHSGGVEGSTGSPEQRFWRRVEKQPSGCWEWQGALSEWGYGSLVIVGRKVPAHRFSYEIHTGPIPEGLVIDHLCRNPSCVNPEHLEAVTNEENIRRGKLAILRRDQVREIRAQVDALCAKYGVSPQTLADIGKRHTWKSLD